jgi:hypothetical protein
VKIVTWRSAAETEQESMSAYQRDASKPVKAANYAWEKAGDLKHDNGSEAATVHFNRQVEIGVRADGSRRTATENVVRDNFRRRGPRAEITPWLGLLLATSDGSGSLSFCCEVPVS